ncbi:MAG: DUF3352 domain-containing protein, partial [Bacteroidales bacterium]|nr:DUF3352 domain-containing protein [Bacteroidales bacterium]
LFTFTDFHKFYSLLLPVLNSDTRRELNSNKEILYNFPYWTTQIIGDSYATSIKLVVDHYSINSSIDEIESDEKDEVLDDNADTEKKQLNELKRFYVEKFQGNILREFYESGALKSETEIKEGKRHGRHREYYENGIMKIRGKYSKGLPKGTWKYYAEDGKFERKEKF